MKSFRRLLFIPVILVGFSSCQEGNEVVPEEPPPAGEKQDAGKPLPPKSSQPTPSTLKDQETLETQSYYTAANLAVAEALIERLGPEVKHKILAEMKAGRKVSAVKILREEGDSSLAICKLTVELLAIRAQVSAGFGH